MGKKSKIILLLLLCLVVVNDTLLARGCRCRCGQKRPILYDYNKQVVDPREGKHLYPICQKPRPPKTCPNVHQ